MSDLQRKKTLSAMRYSELKKYNSELGIKAINLVKIIDEQLDKLLVGKNWLEVDLDIMKNAIEELQNIKPKYQRNLEEIKELEEVYGFSKC